MERSNLKLNYVEIYTKYLENMDYTGIIERINYLEAKANKTIDEDIELYKSIIALKLFNYRLMKLDEDERMCLFYRYLHKEKHSLRTIGKILNCSKNKVSRLINSAISKLVYYTFELGVIHE